MSLEYNTSAQQNREENEKVHAILEENPLILFGLSRLAVLNDLNQC